VGGNLRHLLRKCLNVFLDKQVNGGASPRGGAVREQARREGDKAQSGTQLLRPSMWASQELCISLKLSRGEIEADGKHEKCIEFEMQPLIEAAFHHIFFSFKFYCFYETALKALIGPLSLRFSLVCINLEYWLAYLICNATSYLEL
jgi:hypothetical protein